MESRAEGVRCGEDLVLGRPRRRPVRQARGRLRRCALHPRWWLGFRRDRTSPPTHLSPQQDIELHVHGANESGRGPRQRLVPRQYERRAGVLREQVRQKAPRSLLGRR